MHTRPGSNGNTDAQGQLVHWTELNAWCIQSEEGYRVSKTINSGQPLYDAWPAVRANDTQQLGVYRTAKEAINRCEEHFKTKR